MEQTRKLFKKDKEFLKVIDFYEMLRKLDDLKQERSGEFRKNVNLRIFYRGKEINVNLEKLKEYAEDLEKFISKTKQFLLS
jgi:type I site-specific restriction endonuclease